MILLDVLGYKKFRKIYKWRMLIKGKEVAFDFSIRTIFCSAGNRRANRVRKRNGDPA